MASSYITLVNTNSQIEYGNDMYLVDASADSLTLTLPQVLSNGVQFRFKRIDKNSANTVTIVGFSGELIDLESSYTLNPNTNIKFNTYDNAWYSVQGNAKGMEINMAFNQLVGTQSSKPYVVINNHAFTAVGNLKYKGKKYYGTNPIKFEIAYSINSNGPQSTTFYVQLQDITNIQIVATIGPITQLGDSSQIYTVSTNTFSNIPDNESVFEVDAKINQGTSQIRINSINLVLN